MSEPLRRPAAPAVDVAVAEPLRELLPPLRVAESNDNETALVAREGERVGFQIPAGVWAAMIGCYVLFLATLLAATGGAHATFAIVVSLVYVIMFFGVTRVMVRQSPAQPRSPIMRAGSVLQTVYGPLGRREVFAQMLVVPGMIAFFGVAILVISLAVM